MCSVWGALWGFLAPSYPQTSRLLKVHMNALLAPLANTTPNLHKQNPFPRPNLHFTTSPAQTAPRVTFPGKGKGKGVEFSDAQ